MNDPYSENEKTWDKVAERFVHASSLPVWGPFGVGEDLDLIPEIKDKVFLEIGCGSGRSIKYLTDRSAKKVYGLDISSAQLKEAGDFNKSAISKGKVELIKGKMEDPFKIEPVDIIFSIYAIGWTLDPEKTLENIYDSLKPGGLLIWSWDHSIFTDVQYEDGEYVVTSSYHDEKPAAIKDWKKKGTVAHLVYRKTSTWFKLLKDSGFDIIAYHEPEPKNLDRGSDKPDKYYAVQKAEKVPATFIFTCRKPK